MFQRDGWFYFFERIKGFNPEVSNGFAQCFDKDTVTFDTLRFELTKELISKTTGIAREKEPMYEHVRETLDDDQEKDLENDEKQQRDVSIQEEQLDLKEKKKQNYVGVEENIAKVPVTVELKDDSLQNSNVKLQNRIHVQVEEVNWRPEASSKRSP